MKTHRVFVTLAVTLFLNGCGYTDPVDEIPETHNERGQGNAACGADRYQGFVGEKLAAVSFPGNLKMRLLEPGSRMAPGFDKTRMNVIVNDAGLITTIRCG
ncbi:MAG: I78 family peptidase inhibitor [Pseudomonadota bacterium]